MAVGHRSLALVLLGVGAVITVVGVLGAAGVFEGNGASDDGDAKRPSVERSDRSPASTVAPETPQQFLVQLSQAVRAKDATFLFERLHPFVLERYGETACRAYLGGLSTPAFNIEPLAVVGTGTWDWTTDGLTRAVPGATTVRVRATQDGNAYSETESHVVVQAGKVLWFTDCGTPIAGAR